MGLIEKIFGFVRDMLIERFGERPLERLAELRWLRLPLGGLAAAAAAIAIHVASYTAFEEGENRKEIIEVLEQAGYHSPVVRHLWLGGLCLQGRHPYEWSAGRVHGTACVGGGLRVSIRGGHWWWPFGKAAPPEQP